MFTTFCWIVWAFRTRFCQFKSFQLLRKFSSSKFSRCSRFIERSTTPQWHRTFSLSLTSFGSRFTSSFFIPSCRSRLLALTKANLLEPSCIKLSIRLLDMLIRELLRRWEKCLRLIRSINELIPAFNHVASADNAHTQHHMRSFRIWLGINVLDNLSDDHLFDIPNAVRCRWQSSWNLKNFFYLQTTFVRSTNCEWFFFREHIA